MWWAGSERVVVYVGMGSAGVGPRAAEGDAPTKWLFAGSAVAAFEQVVQSLKDGTSQARRRCALDIQLSGALARPFMFEAVDGLKTWKEALEVAATLAPDATGLPGPCAVWLDDWVRGQRCVAVAIDVVLRDRIEQIARDDGLRIATLRPWWAVATDAAVASLVGSVQLLSVEDTDSMTVFTSASGVGYAALATYAPKPAPGQARAVVTRAAMAANLQSGDIASAWLGQPITQADDSPDVDRAAPSLVPRVGRWM